MAANDPFAFDSQEYIPLVIKEPPPVVKTPISVKKKSPRVASSRKKEEDEKKELKLAIEESKKTALKEERARRYKKRVAQQKPPSPHPASESETDSCGNICSPTPSLTTPSVKGETPPLKTNTSVLKLSPFVKDSTPTLEETTSNVEEITSNVEDTTPCLNNLMEATPNKDVHVGSSSSSGGRFMLKRKRLITSSKEPAIKLMRLDTRDAGVGSSKFPAGGGKSPPEQADTDNEVEKRITKEVVQEDEMKNTPKEKGLVKESVKEKEIAKESVKKNEKVKQAVIKKETVKEPVKEKDAVKQAVKKKETIKEKEAVKQSEVVKQSVKKTETVKDNDMVTATIKIKETTKEAVKEEAVKEVVKRKETVKEKEIIKGAIREKDMTRQAIKEKETIKQSESVKEKETVKESVKGKGIVKEKETNKAKASVKENGDSFHDTASPRTHKSLTLGGKKPTAHVEGKRTEASPKEGREIQVHKTTIVKDKSLDPLNQLKTRPQLYTPRGTKPSECLPVIVKFFEDFKLQLRMAQSTRVSFVPWSPPLTNCTTKNWQSRGDQYTERSVSKSSSVLVLSPPIKQSQQRKQEIVETVDVSPTQDWGRYVYDSDDQKLFNDSDYDVDPRSSQPGSTFNCRQTPLPLDDITDTVAASNSINRSPDKPTGVVSPHIRDISIDISSSDSELSSVIAKNRRKRKPVGARLVADSSGDIAATPEADNDRFSLTPSFSRAPLHPLSSQSPSQNSREPVDRQGVIDLTDETTELESPSRPSTSADFRPLLDKQVACPICKQLFSETYIEAHAANCDLHVESAHPVPTSTTTKYKQTTLVGRPYKRTTPPPPSESGSDDDNHEGYLPSTKRRYLMKKRKLLPRKTTSIPLAHSEESDDIEAPQEPSFSTGKNASAVDAIFESSDCFGREMDDIGSYSSEEDNEDTMTANTNNARDTIIDYKNQFPVLQIGKVSKELISEDNSAFIEATKKKWMSSKRGKSSGRGHQKRWAKSKGRGRGKR